MSRASIVVQGRCIEYAWFGGGVAVGRVPAIVLLHEGLGCLSMWRDFPARLADVTGRRVLAYSRAGYGGSDPVPLPRPLTYMHEEAQGALPALLDALAVEDVVLVGHSDGGSIALIAAGTPSASLSARVRSVVAMAPHVFAEDLSIASIAEARAAFDAGPLRDKLARYHRANVDVAFRGWNDAWLDPGFRAWNIEAFLPHVSAPTLCVQGDGDRYGTLAQLDAIERGVSGPFTRLVLADCGHDPARDAPDATLAAIQTHLTRPSL